MSSFLSTIHGQQQCSGDHVTGPQFVIRQVLAQDIATVYDLVSAEHWALSPADCQLIHRTQPDGLLGAYTAEDDTLIGKTSVLINTKDPHVWSFVVPLSVHVLALHGCRMLQRQYIAYIIYFDFDTWTKFLQFNSNLHASSLQFFG